MPPHCGHGGNQLLCEMGRQNKRLGKHAVVSVKLAHVSNKKLWSEIKGAGYREMRETFTVIGQMVDDESGKKMVRLRLSHVEHDGKEFDAAAGMCRLLRAGPPNMRFCDSPAQLGSKLSKAAFRRALAGKLVRNSMIPDPDATLQVSTSPDGEDDRPHQLRTVPKHGGRFKAGGFPTIKAEYVKWPCYLCKRKVLTYCECNPSRIVCSMCWHAHVKNP